MRMTEKERNELTAMGFSPVTEYFWRNYAENTDITFDAKGNHTCNGKCFLIFRALKMLGFRD